MLALFSLVAQSLRTGEPLHEVLPTSLCDRLFYHQHRSDVLSNAPDHRPSWVELEQVQTLDYMFYATALIAVYQLLKVNLSRRGVPARY